MTLKPSEQQAARCTLEKVDSWGICAGCASAHVPRNHYGFAMVNTYRGVRHIRVFACCANCFASDVALAEADDDGRRYTAIEVGTASDGFNGKRCICGAVRHARLGLCVQCSRAHRMLDKAASEARLISKLLKELRAEVKTQQRELDEQPT